jgi:hypothetical protein
MSDEKHKNKEVVAVKDGGTAMTFQCPILNSTNYTIWAVKIRAIFNVHGIWEAVEPVLGTEVDQKKNNIAIAMLYQSIPESMVLQIADLTSAKDIWEALKVRHVGVDRVKEARLQTLESEFESLKMKESETLDEFSGKISQLVSQANSLGSTIDNKRLVRKLLGSVPAKFIQIVAAIEQFADLNTMQFQEAIGRLKAYEERIKKPEKEEDTHDKLLFTKEEDKDKFKEHKCERCGHGNSIQGSSGRGRGKNWKSWRNKEGIQVHQNKDHIRCYKCNELGHFKHECPKWNERKEEVNLVRHEDDEPTLL